MNLHRLLLEREDRGEPLRVGLIGAGKFGCMYLSQALRTPGIQLAGVADLNPGRARESLLRAGWSEDRFGAKTFAEALAKRSTWVSDDALALIAGDGLDVVIDATGDPAAGIRHVAECCRNRRDIIMVNVEADALAGPLLARRAREAGIIYSLAYGDQPALICELVDWARACGFEVAAAGKGTKYLPHYHASTPETVWGHYGFTPQTVSAGDFNAQMFNSFLDGTKSAIEMTAVANATGLTAAPQGLAFPPCGVDDLPQVLKPASAGGQLHHLGQVEVVASLKRDGSPVARDLRWGVYVTIKAGSPYVARCFREYGLTTDDSGNYAAMYKPAHLIGLELGISVASIVLRREPTGAARGFLADAVAVAKRALKPGEALDGEGGYTVYGKLMPARDSLAANCLPIGLARGVKVTRAVGAGAPLSWDDVEVPETNEAASFRREMEAVFAAG